VLGALRAEARELPVLRPQRVEVLDPVDRIGEEHPLAVAVEAVVVDGARRRAGGRRLERLARQAQAVGEAVARVGDGEEAAAPDRRDGEGVGIEAGGELGFFAEAQANGASDGDPSAAEDPRLHRTQPRPLPTVVAPGVLVLSAPVAGVGAVEARVGGEQGRRVVEDAEVVGLSGVEVVDARAVERVVVARPALWMERPARRIEGRRAVEVGAGVVEDLGHGVGARSVLPPEVAQQAQEVGARPAREGVHEAVGHRAAAAAPRLDLGAGEALDVLVGGIEEHDARLVLLDDQARAQDAVRAEHTPQAVLLGDVALGPQERDGELLVAALAADAREVRPDRAAVLADPVAAEAGGLGRSEDGRAAQGVSGLARVADEGGDGGVLGGFGPCPGAGRALGGRGSEGRRGG
jgi:hypothetical protein